MPKTRRRMELPDDYLVALGGLSLATLAVQFGATRLTNAKRWSIQAMVRNLAIVCSIYSAYVLEALWPLVVPVVLEAAMELSNWRFRAIEPYLRTEYLYSDYFERFVEPGSSLRYYSEGIYSELLGLDTTDLSQENVATVMRYGEEQFLRGYREAPRETILHADGETELPLDEVARRAQDTKFRWIAEHAGLLEPSDTPRRVLEIGFGKLDFMEFVRRLPNTEVVGVNLSSEQVRQARERGFTAIRSNFWDVLDHRAELGRFDFVMANGSLEYFKRSTEAHERYRDVFSIVRQLLVPEGRFMVTTIHNAEDESHAVSAYDYLCGYLLWAGNDGHYPYRRDGLTRYATQVGFEVEHQQNRWLDYYLFSVVWSILYRARNRLGGAATRSWRKRLTRLLKAVPLLIADPHFVHSYLCYTPTRNIRLWPWMWQFLQQRDGWTPTTHEWIVFRATGGDLAAAPRATATPG